MNTQLNKYYSRISDLYSIIVVFPLSGNKEMSLFNPNNYNHSRFHFFLLFNIFHTFLVIENQNLMLLEQ